MGYRFLESDVNYSISHRVEIDDIWIVELVTAATAKEGCYVEVKTLSLKGSNISFPIEEKFYTSQRYLPEVIKQQVKSGVKRHPYRGVLFGKQIEPALESTKLFAQLVELISGLLQDHSKIMYTALPALGIPQPKKEEVQWQF